MNQPIERTPLEQALIAGFAEFETRVNGDAKSNLHSLRKEAINVLTDKGFPHVKLEDWRYTNLKPALTRPWNVTTPELQVGKDELERFLIPGLDTLRMVFVNGIFNVELSSLHGVPDGIVVTTHSEALKSNRAIVETHLGKYIQPQFNGLVAANTALARNGLFVYVPKGIVLDRPIHFISLAGGSNPFIQLRNLVVAEESAEFTVIETTASLDSGESFSNVVTEISAAPNAKVNHCKLQLENENAVQTNVTQIHQQQDSLCNSFTITIGGGLVRNDLNFTLGAENCESHLYGLYITDGKQHFDNHTFVDHAMPHCFSNEFYKGIMMDQSTAVFNGKILVRPDAQKTNAYQSNKNVLLSEEAKINTKPQLEIFADDVKCSHGATTGQLDEEALFYMRSRGIDAQSAKALLTYAFAADVLDHVTIEPLKEYLEAAVHGKLGI
jgi:Fe-S cluster assembly protein SufD